MVTEAQRLLQPGQRPWWFRVHDISDAMPRPRLASFWDDVGEYWCIMEQAAAEAW